MKRIYFILALVLFQGCDDGDIITTSFEFDDVTVQLCDEYLFYKVDDATNESLTFLTNTSEPILDTEGSYTITLNGTTDVLNYRRYSGSIPATYFCSEIPPTNPQVTAEFTADNGTASIVSTVFDDDNDGIASTNEGDATQDSDGDLIPDFKDFDDDGDNVPTADENPDPNNDGDLSDAQDTDADGIPDYLDTDDDGDGILTIQEDIDGDLNPQNDVNSSATNVPDYLNNAAVTATSPPITTYREHSFQQQFVVRIIFNGITLENGTETIVEEQFNFGSYSTTSQTVTETPPFN